MAVSEKLQARQEKTKEKLEAKAIKKQEDAQKSAGEAAADKPAKSAPAEKKKEKPKAEIKKPTVTEAFGRGEFMPISPKHAVEICRAIKGKSVNRARAILHLAIEQKEPIKLTKHHKNVAHRKGKGFASGRYMVKASKRILNVLDNAIANAAYLNLDGDRLYVKGAVPNRAVSKQRGGKYTHLKLILAENKPKVKK
ncbi:MAG TPA: 50S ribosomal protein L22 [Candidatus Woesearchaeota archaeon]|nr:50S ribosomal protein L22 [Candidatus Woesearchaeota archaeon]